ncbi:hypothetical protein WJX72_008147 [[Myrmecia] bisecta]|uniref:Patatin n=1 Tax=[Myrmecia] bisecta TaxID=41462 RepID=A0AAW1Q5T8_9CHLO
MTDIAPSAVVKDQAKAGKPPTIVYPDQPVPYLRVERKRPLKTILSIDGGGIRGLIPAVVLEYLEFSIKQAIVKGRAAIKVTADSELKTIPDDPNKFYILLADYFDVVAGTSTGAILATYLAAKGAKYDAPADPDIKRFLAGLPADTALSGGRDAAYWRKRYSANSLHRGAISSAQAIFLAKSNFIFPKPDFSNPKMLDNVLPPEEELNPLLATIKDRITGPVRFYDILGHAKNWFIDRIAGDTWTKASLLDKLSAEQREKLASSLWGVLRPKYTAQGIEATLKLVLEDARFSTKDALHTSLVVQSFELDYNRPFTFWFHRPAQMSGYATLSRALTKEEEQDMDLNFFEPPTEDDFTWLPEFTFIPGVDVSLAQVVRSSTAAPTFLPAATVDLTYTPKKGPNSPGNVPVTVPRQLCDGGVCANSPTMIAVAFAVGSLRDGNDLPINLKQTATLSLGTGQTVTSTKLASPDAGALDWVLRGGRLVDILSSSAPEIQAALGEFFLFKEIGLHVLQFVRIQTTAINIEGSPDDEKDIPLSSGRNPSEVLKHMDDSTFTWDLLEIGERAVQANWTLIDAFVKHNLFPGEGNES